MVPGDGEGRGPCGRGCGRRASRPGATAPPRRPRATPLECTRSCPADSGWNSRMPASLPTLSVLCAWRVVPGSGSRQNQVSSPPTRHPGPVAAPAPLTPCPSCGMPQHGVLVALVGERAPAVQVLALHGVPVRERRPRAATPHSRPCWAQLPLRVRLSPVSPSRCQGQGQALFTVVSAAPEGVWRRARRGGFLRLTGRQMDRWADRSPGGSSSP